MLLCKLMDYSSIGFAYTLLIAQDIILIHGNMDLREALTLTLMMGWVAPPDGTCAKVIRLSVDCH
ncbi:hypothetical protein BFP70_19310 [Thioclava sp. SK-1]|nr:hypothetical protein BFP70_19310 [Thioclava sp. SK-1]